MTSRSPRRRATVRIAYGAATVLTLLLALAAFAPQLIDGPRFGRVVGWMLPPMRGSIHVGGGRWTWAGVWALWRGRPAALSLDDVRVLDPEGIEVLRAAHLTGAVELARDRSRLVIRDLRVADAAWRFAQMQGTRAVGFLAAFQPVPKAGARPRRRGGLASFAIVGAELDGLDATFDFPDWGLALARVHARGNLALGPGAPATGAAPAGPIFTFDVSDADLRAGGRLRVLRGRARVELPLSGGRITRVATTAAAPDAIEIEAAVATGRSRLALAGAFTGIYGVSRPRQPAGIDLRARFSTATDAVRAILGRLGLGILPVAVAGDDASLQLAFSGPFDRLAITAAARGFDVRLRDLEFRGVAVELSAQPLAGRARLSGLTFASPAGGRLTLDAEIDRRQVHGALVLERFATAPYLPGFLRPLAGGILDGRLRAGLDLGDRSATIDELALTLVRPPGAWGPRRLSFSSGAPGAAAAMSSRAGSLRVSGARFVRGTLILPTIGARIAGGRVTARARIVLADAAGHLRPPIFDVDAEAHQISFERVVSASFARGTLSFRARARGPLDDLDVDLDVPPGQSLRLFGESCALPASTAIHLGGDGVTLRDFRLRGSHGAELAVAGRVGLTGQLALSLDVRDFPFGKLPALAEAELPFSGRLSGRLQASGPARAPQLAGRLQIDQATFQGRPIGGGAVAITPRPGGAIHAEGQVIEGVTVDGTLAPAEGGLRGLATLRLRAVRLDPFLSELPGGARAAGVISGTLGARISPSEAPSVEGRLSELALTVTGALPPRSRPGGSAPPSPTHTLELHAVGEVRLSAHAGGGPMRMEPARFAGTAGSVELWGETERGRSRGGARGRLTLGAVAPLVLPWLSRLSGDLDFDVAARAADAGTTPVVTGIVRVATPVSFRIAGFPFDARVASGRVRLDDDGVTHLDLPLTLGRGTLQLTGTVTSPVRGEPRMALDLAGDLDAHLLALAAPGAVASAEGSAHLVARLEGRPVRPSVRARVRPTTVTLALRALPLFPVAIAGGEIDVDDRSVVVRALHIDVARKIAATIGAPGDGAAALDFGSLFDARPARVVLPLRGRLTAMPVPPAIIDDATFQLRLDGDLSRRARLAGEVTLTRGRVPQARGKPAARAAKPATAPWQSRPELAHVELALHAVSRGGALAVEVPHLPDVHVDVDYRVGGTIAKPQISGNVQGADLYSSFLLFLRGLFQ